MSISDKTRKILWGRSGNRCAICKNELVINTNQSDDESVIGDECHIISGKPDGPRYDSSFPRDKLDAYENLILLCRIHHKMVDDQCETYTVHILRQMKNEHEVCVSKKLSDIQRPKPIKIKRVKQNIPAYLTRLTTGKEVLNLVENALASSMDHDELKSEAEVDLVGGFLQTIRDWGDIGRDLGPADRARIAFDLTNTLQEFDECGFWVFGAREVQILEGGEKEPMPWPVAIILILRKNNTKIFTVEQNEKNS